jgi:hypothetical protein
VGQRDSGKGQTLMKKRIPGTMCALRREMREMRIMGRYLGGYNCSCITLDRRVGQKKKQWCLVEDYTGIWNYKIT